MIKIPALILGCVVAAICIVPSASSAGEAQTSSPSAAPQGFTALFNGKNLEGWWGATTEDPAVHMAMAPEEFRNKRDASLADIRKHWSVQNGELVNDGDGLCLATDKYYGDFELLLEFKTASHADGGVHLRGCPQVRIWSWTEKPKLKTGANEGSGGLWNNSPGAPGRDPLVMADKLPGQWNAMRIIMVGSRVWVWLNDKQTVDGALMENHYNRKIPVPARGPIQLRTHGGEIRWRNLHMREIPAAEATALLRARAATDCDFKSIFNGRDFEGWDGPLDCCEVENGAIVWQPKKGGTIYTKETYADFVVRMEFRFPPAGNNGLALRYPGHGNPAFDGMCELQILSDDYEAVTGRKLDPRQVHGSAYGMAAAQGGYQRAVGEWNYQEVTVVGPIIKVELNGTPVLDADLSAAPEPFMRDRQHPGRTRTSGHFGFAGHNDPVAFRNIEIKRLDQ
jgi:hypothetical protein